MTLTATPRRRSSFFWSVVAHSLAGALLLSLGGHVAIQRQSHSSVTVIAPILRDRLPVQAHKPKLFVPPRPQRSAQALSFSPFPAPVQIQPPPPAPVIAPAYRPPQAMPPAPVIETRAPAPIRPERIVVPARETGAFTAVLRATEEAGPAKSTQSAGFAPLTTGGANPSRQVQTARDGGFGEARPAHDTVARNIPLATGGFAEVRTAALSQPRRSPALSNSDGALKSSPVEILETPHPAYTAEARQLRIEGQVLVSVIFAAAGDVRVLGIRQGLGHGLDEKAIAAAGAIRFRPAQREGQPVDAAGIVHIHFELAY